MSAITNQAVLDGLKKINHFGAKAESIETDELLKNTFSIPAHMNALEPEVLLVLGGRGTGKSHLFRLLNMEQGVKALDPAGTRHRLANALWIKGFSAKTESTPDIRFPAEASISEFAKGKNRTQLMAFWWGLLAGTLLQKSDEEVAAGLRGRLPKLLASKLTNNFTSISVWFDDVLNHLEKIETACNVLDDELTDQNRFLFATYDDLDVLTVEWDEKRALIQSLLQFWLGQWRRWRRIRPKIFLRLDLYSPDFLKFPDASKLEGNKIVLQWKPNQLYQMVFKIWSNQNKESRAYLTGEGKLNLKNDALLGWTFSREPALEELKTVIHKIIGQFMGKGAKRGRSFDWIPNHLQDTNGEIFPRSILNLFALAARDEIENRRAKENLLLAPDSFGRAIEQVSQHRINELTEEYPWLESMRPSLEGQRVPMTRDAFSRLLDKIKWSVNRPPSAKPDQLIDHLIKIGIIRVTNDKRIHFPDIYLYGFGLKRTGGIRRPRDA